MIANAAFFSSVDETARMVSGGSVVVEPRQRKGSAGSQLGLGTCRVLIAALLLTLPAVPALASPPGTSVRESKAEVRSIRGLSQVLFHSQPLRTSNGSETERIRKRLADLRRALVELERDATPARIERLRSRKAGAVKACKRLRSDFQVVMEQLWRDVDYALVDPIGQRARLQTARHRIDAALEQPADVHGPSMILLLDLAPRGGR